MERCRSRRVRLRLAIEEMDYYDFPLTGTMREAFGFGGDLRILRDPRLRRGWLMHERPTGELAHWDVPGAKRDDVVRIDG